MKPFSKEWWLKKGFDVEHHGFIYNMTHERRLEVSQYCFKRYAEAYHREKMAFTESPLMTMHKKGQEAEQKRILGIIEEINKEGDAGEYDICFTHELIRKINGKNWYKRE